MGLDGDFLPEDEFTGGVLGVVAVGLALLGEVDAAETDTFMFAAMKSFICIRCPSVFSDRRTDRGHEYF